MRDHYRIMDLLGKGAFGEARKCVWKESIHNKKNSYKDYRAVKVMSRAYMEKKHEEMFQNEV
jgi:serine/threonine protein kinase|tara:strand:- start:372 stop:557 length:186 start_codon:yes stop_codon:yes gene_type:complete